MIPKISTHGYKWDLENSEEYRLSERRRYRKNEIQKFRYKLKKRISPTVRLVIKDRIKEILKEDKADIESVKEILNAKLINLSNLHPKTKKIMNTLIKVYSYFNQGYEVKDISRILNINLGTTKGYLNEKHFRNLKDKLNLKKEIHGKGRKKLIHNSGRIFSNI